MMNVYESTLTLDELDKVLASSEATYCFSDYDIYSLADEHDAIKIYPSDIKTKYQYIYAIGWTIMKETWDKLYLKRKDEK